MQYNTLLLVTAFTSGISFLLVYRVAVLDENFKRLKRDLDLVSLSGKPKPAFSKPEELNNGILAGIVARGQQGAAISSEGNKILIQQNGFYMVYGQVLFLSPGAIMGHIVRSSGSQTSQKSFDLLRCLQEMPQTNSANTCYTAGLVKLDQRDELELVIPDRPQAQVSMDADSTFFGIMQLT
ncbi:tumor necrosis factor ligand superfamily member 13B-like isoform X4 [Hypomesus transpacificus]|uniref:tumor necrosis factor ligand superfamily member 13B-like isoform X4 n=1 Tax=Hypomesus transpacificus TaxID=137520 RepID=UPI001F08070B|nr:tumor necrosis factor ligand superfamily member 13B-like isoform X4 [Hypomesus transpacificus]